MCWYKLDEKSVTKSEIDGCCLQTSRKELASELEELKSKVTGAGGGVEK